MKTITAFLVFILPYYTTLALPTMRQAPRECPLENGNLLDVVLFAKSDEECRQMCANNEKCIFYHFYKGKHVNFCTCVSMDYGI